MNRKLKLTKSAQQINYEQIGFFARRNSTRH